jgi:hypothetical protein
MNGRCIDLGFPYPIGIKVLFLEVLCRMKLKRESASKD